MANLTRNSCVSTGNKGRDGIPSHLWSKDNTPWSPDTTLPWQDEEMTAQFENDGTNEDRNTKPTSSNLTRN